MDTMRRPSSPFDAAAVCNLCRMMVSSRDGLRSLASRTGYAHYTKSEARASAKGGCHLCKSICDAGERWLSSERLTFFAVHRGKKWCNFIQQESFENTSDVDDFSLLSFDSLVGYGEDAWPSAQLVAMTETNDPAAKYIIGRLPLARVGEKSTTDQAKSWIEECLNSHKDCPSLERHLLPTRVIDVKADSVQGGARLHISTENETADYATLSYCWGEATGSVILTTATLEAWKERLPVENLPRSLQDAVKITRDLGIRYLWVDALCIVQEDIGEKKKEIERMGKIYKNSLVTIAAANSRSASDGFLSDRDLPGVTTLPFPCPNGTTGKISLAKFVSTYHPEQPLDRRAWALQEYLLSPRLLMYGASELTWHCQTQAFHKVGESHLLYWPFINRLPPEIFNPGYPTPEDAPRSRQELWASIVRDYSGRLLTYPEDKASAIAGVANELSEAWNDEYVWGAWKGDLVFYLAWYRDPGVARNITRSERAPSWSWLSLDCEVVFLPTRRRILARVVQYPLAQPEMPSEPRHDAGTRLVIRAKILTTDELDSGELKTWNIIRDLSNESSVEAKSYFLLLGIWWDKDPLCLVLKSLDNGTFRRVGSAFNCKTYKWDSLPDETITLV